MSSVTGLLKNARQRHKNEDEKTANSKRFKEILAIARKYDILKGLTPEKTVNMLQELGTMFVKIGQIMSTHPDMIPPEYCEALGSLRTKAAPMDYETVKTQVEGELGKPIDELFSEFDQKAVGSASIAQVHRAVLPNGTVVAVKVQRPDVVETVTNDLAIMERMVDLYGLVDRGESGLSLKELVAELVKTSIEELDFNNEAANLERFYNNNEPREGVTSPKCYRDYSTSAILTEDYVHAPCAEDIDTLGLSEAEREELAYLVASNYMQQVMEDGFYHADPHAGNVLILDSKNIEWIDFGMMGTMTSNQREALSDLIGDMVKGDAYSLKRHLFKIATTTTAVDHAALLATCETIVDQFVSVDLESFDTGALLNTMTQNLEESGFDVDPFLVNLGRGLVTLEGTIHHISPKLNIMEVLTNYLVSSFDPKSIERTLRRALNESIEGAQAMAGLPTKCVETLDMIQKGQARLGMELSSTGKFSEDAHSIAGMVSLAFIASALIIGASILGSAANVFAPGVAQVLSIGGLVLGLAVAIFIFVKTKGFFK